MRHYTFRSGTIGLMGLCASTFLLSLGASETGDSSPYAPPYRGEITQALLPLPLGAVRPEGWLRQWALTAKSGMTLELDKRHQVFAEAWTKKWNGWPLEQCAYWLDGLVRLGFILDDEEMITKARGRLDHVLERLSDTSRSFMYWQKEAAKGFDNWANSHLARALFAYYQATDDKTILARLVQVYKQFNLPDFGRTSGTVNAAMMVDVFLQSGQPEIRGLLAQALDKGKIGKVIDLWAAGRVTKGARVHGVIVDEYSVVPLAYYLLSGDPTHLQASLRRLAWIDEEHMQPYGVHSGDEYVCGRGPFRGTEVCDISSYMWWMLWFQRVTGQGQFGDRIERAFFNAHPASVTRDFSEHLYCIAPNRFAEDLPRHVGKGSAKRGYRYQPLHKPLCCTGNLHRAIPYYLQHMWMATPDGGLAATLYGPCSLRALVGGKVPVAIVCTTDYPFNETIGLEIRPAQSVAFPLSLRIPAWCSEATVTINGDRVPAQPDEQGYLRVLREWQDGDRLTLKLPMPILIEKRRSNQRVNSGQTTPDLPYATVSQGPLLFALPIAEQDPNTPDPTSDWHYALIPDSDAISVTREAMPKEWRWQAEAPVHLTAPARRIAWQASMEQELPDAPFDRGERTAIRLVPFGCTQMRVSMFPIAKP